MNQVHTPVIGKDGKPQLHFIGDIPRLWQVVAMAREAARLTGWKIIFIPDHPKHPPHRLSVWTYESFGNQRPFWAAFEALMAERFGEDESQWPTTVPNDGPLPPRSTTRYFHS